MLRVFSWFLSLTWGSKSLFFTFNIQVREHTGQSHGFFEGTNQQTQHRNILARLRKFFNRVSPAMTQSCQLATANDKTVKNLTASTSSYQRRADDVTQRVAGAELYGLSDKLSDKSSTCRIKSLLLSKLKNRDMIGMNFRKWSTSSRRVFTYERIFNKGKWTPFVKIKFRYTQESRKELQDQFEETAKELAKKNMILEDLRPIIEVGDYERLSWLGLPPILQDLGFDLKEEPPKGDQPPIDIYYRDAIACYKRLDGMWVVTKEKYSMAFDLPTKFHAFQLFTMLGIKFKDEDSTAAGLDRPIADVLAEGKEESHEDKQGE